MELRPLGRSGLSLSVTGLGCNNFGGRIDFEATRRVIHKALDLGVNFFDTADTYGGNGGERGRSEEYLGRILGPRRSEAIIATKFGLPMSGNARPRNASSRYVMAAVEASLKRLGTDYIDLYQVHFPDPDTPIEETLTALDALVRQGKVRHIGCANFEIWQLIDAVRTAKDLGLAGPVSCQNQYSLLVQDAEQEILPAAASFNLGFLPYYPLAGGFLTGKYRKDAPLPAGTRLASTKRLAERYVTERNWRLVEKLEAFVASRGRTLLELAFAWLLAHAPVSSVIAGATGPEQVEANAKAAEWTLSTEDMDAVERAFTIA
jgi:aryl-alcohol dehydrogenase-like predicted oxidoreductase